MASVKPERAYRKMPKLHQKRSVWGCVRCKARKVKCDEATPECGACQRHQVVCVYTPRTRPSVTESTRLHEDRSSDHTSGLSQAHARDASSPSRWQSNAPNVSLVQHNNAAAQLQGGHHRTPESLLELRLLHNFCSNTGSTLSTAPSIWTDAAPRLGLTHQFLLDACFATSALHLSRLDPADAHLEDVSAVYFERAIVGHAKAQQTSDVAAVADAIFLATSMISFYSLVRTGNPTPQDEDALFQWLRLGRGSRIVFVAFNRSPQTEVAATAIHAPPNLVDDAVVFDPANITDNLKVLLEWGADFEMITAEDETTYQQILSFICLVYTSAKNGEPTLWTCRRLLGMPSRAPERFHDLIAERRPRALVMLAYHFAAFTLAKDEIWWTRNIAERHVRFLYRLLPRAWKSFMQEPLRLVGLREADFLETDTSPATANT